MRREEATCYVRYPSSDMSRASRSACGTQPKGRLRLGAIDVHREHIAAQRRIIITCGRVKVWDCEERVWMPYAGLYGHLDSSDGAISSLVFEGTAVMRSSSRVCGAGRSTRAMRFPARRYRARMRQPGQIGRAHV